MEEYDYLFKIVIIGDSGVGKSSILYRYSDKDFSHNYLSTIGVDFKIFTINYQGKKIKLQIWDTAGQERFRTITSTYYRGVNGLIAVYSITDLNSFNNIDMWLGEIEKYGSGNCSKIIIGNKCDDNNNRQVSYTIAKDFADNKNLIFIESSAKENINITKLFEILIDDMYSFSKINSHQIVSKEFYSIDLLQQEKTSKCCL